MRDVLISEIAKAYGGQQVLRRLTLRIPAGKVTCLMAPSGAGKTTLLRLLMGLEKPDSGVISGLEGVRIAAVFQEDRLIEGFDAVSNIRLTAADRSNEEVCKAIRRVGMEDVAGKPVAELSGGMRRRVALLRALMAKGQLLLLDEPFQGLDEHSKKLAVGEIFRWRKDRTILLVTHDPLEASMLHADIQTLEACEQG